MREMFSDQEPQPSFNVDPKGGYLTGLYASPGDPILFEKTQLDGKTRGGSHVCLPNFGPDSSGKLDQHGFGRDREWSLESATPNASQLSLPSIDEGDYAGLSARLIYQLHETGNALTMRLIATNRGDHELAISPGFHPYFAIGEDGILLNGEPVELGEYQEAKTSAGPVQIIETNGKRLTLRSDDLQTWVLWTDLRGAYFCVEPTLNGPGFDSNYPRDNELLAPGIENSQRYQFTISWEDLT